MRKIWVYGLDLQVDRMQIFGPKGLLLSDIRLADWQPTDSAGGTSAPPTPSNSVASFPRVIRIERPHDDYKLDLQVTKVIVNEEIPAERFKVEQPTGAAVVLARDATENNQP